MSDFIRFFLLVICFYFQAPGGRVQLSPLARRSRPRRPSQTGHPRRPPRPPRRLVSTGTSAREVPVQPTTSVHVVDADRRLYRREEPLVGTSSPLRAPLRLAGQNHSRDLPVAAAHPPPVERQASDRLRARISARQLLAGHSRLPDRVLPAVSHHDRDQRVPDSQRSAADAAKCRHSRSSGGRIDGDSVYSVYQIIWHGVAGTVNYKIIIIIIIFTSDIIQRKFSGTIMRYVGRDGSMVT